ncbi:MAG: AAA family ATPase [Methanomassiliicoccaceae archaeon]|nr:AAA family ATPase [Methanomassiliicoccaceae archaeon]
MRKVAVYGKGGIGKSTISSNLTAALSEKGMRVMQIGCDPKHDSTRLLIAGIEQRTVLEYLRDTKENERKLEDITETGYKGCICVEAGGPEPGVGCAGRGIISAFDLLEDLGINEIELDAVLYDVLGDVVCGGFAVPLRNDYADTVYIVTSGEYMSIYAANNILRGTANYDPDRIGGLIFNSRGDDEEKERVMKFSCAVGVPVIAEFSRSKMFLEAERIGKTVVEAFPDSEIAEKFRKLADTAIEGKKHTARFLSDPELESAVLGRSVAKITATEEKGRPGRSEDTSGRSSAKLKETHDAKTKQITCSAPRKTQKEVVHGCAFAGTLCTTLSVEGLASVLHAPRDCAHYAVQMVTNALRRSFTNGDVPIRPFALPNVRCSNMDDADTIFGAVSKLESDVNHMIDKGNDTIAVITSCPSGIIGEDIDGMISRIKKKNPDVTIIPIIEDGNIKGDYMQGATDACIELIRALSEEGKKERSVNLIGMKTFGINTVENVRFVSEVLEKLGIEVNCTCVGDTTVEKIRNIPRSELCILMTPDSIAVETMNFIRSRFGLRSTDNMARPGMMETELWIREAAAHFGENEKAELAIKEIRNEFIGRLESLKWKLKGKKVYIVGMKRDINWIMEAAVGCGMDVLRHVVIDITDREEVRDLEKKYGIELIPGGRKENIKGMRDRTERILDPHIPVDPDTDAWIRKDMAEKEPDLLLSTYPIDSGKDVRTCFLPVNPNVTPFAGPEFAELWSRTLKAPVKEGWRKDVV